jgi:hypothetical protein
MKPYPIASLRFDMKPSVQCEKCGDVFFKKYMMQVNGVKIMCEECAADEEVHELMVFQRVLRRFGPQHPLAIDMATSVTVKKPLSRCALR